MTVICVLAAACGDDEVASPTTVATTVAPTVAPTGDFLDDAATACGNANQAAYSDAERLGYWDHPLTPEEQAEYYEGRATQVADLLVALGALEPSPELADGWPAALDQLAAYQAWATTNVATIQDTGATVPEASPESLHSFRAAFELGYGHACQDLFDMN